jgi:hypothetical protein
LYEGSGLEGEAAVEHLSCAEGLLRKAAFDNWDPTVLEEAAVAAGLAGPLAEVFGRVWRSERAKVKGLKPRHERLMGGCRSSMLAWGSWRAAALFTLASFKLPLSLSQVHEALLKRSTWNSSLRQLSWRVDVKTASKDKDDLNEPSAIFELDTKAGTKEGGASSDGTTLRFEMSREQLGSVLDEFKAVEAQLALFK